jgi:hypothetical protein
MGWSASDQVALPYVLHARQKIYGLSVGVTTLPGDVYESPWFKYVPHGQKGATTR